MRGAGGKEQSGWDGTRGCAAAAAGGKSASLRASSALQTGLSCRGCFKAVIWLAKLGHASSSPTPSLHYQAALPPLQAFAFHRFDEEGERILDCINSHKVLVGQLGSTEVEKAEAEQCLHAPRSNQRHSRDENQAEAPARAQQGLCQLSRQIGSFKAAP